MITQCLGCGRQGKAATLLLSKHGMWGHAEKNGRLFYYCAGPVVERETPLTGIERARYLITRDRFLEATR